MPKKRTGGDHKTPRKPMQLPEDWLNVAKELAAEHRQPMTWYVISLLAREAEAAGKKLPKMPWEIET